MIEEKIVVARGARKLKFTVPKALKGDKEFADIMIEQGYHPAGYGSPFDISEDKNNHYFYSWSSCD